MGDTFACPECGNALELRGQTPGRLIRCGWCRTWVEVPFLPRAARRRGDGAGRPPFWLGWAWVAVGLLSALVVVLGVIFLFASRSRSLDERALTQLTVSADANEREGRFDRALTEIEAALVLAEKAKPKQPARLDSLRQQRDRLSRREAEARLASLEGLDAFEAVGQCQALLARANDDPALVPLEATIRERLQQYRHKSLETDTAAARQAFVSGRPAEAFALTERIARLAADLPGAEERRRVVKENDALVRQIVAHYGVAVEPIGGQFTLGSPDGYAKALRAPLTDALKQNAYLPRPTTSEWRATWNEVAPYVLTIAITERFGVRYLESTNRISFLEARLTLTRQKSVQWQVLVSARTKIPVPNLSAYASSRLAIDDSRGTGVERALHDDARTRLIEAIVGRLRAMPPLEPPPAEAAASDTSSQDPAIAPPSR